MSTATKHRSIPRTPSGLELPRGADGRTRAARRFRDLYEAFAAELGTPLTEPEKGLVRQAVGLQILSETMQERIVAGAMVDPDQAIRIAGTSRRLLQIIAGKTGKRPEAQVSDLDRYLAEHYAADEVDTAVEAEPIPYLWPAAPQIVSTMSVWTPTAPSGSRRSRTPRLRRSPAPPESQ